MVVDKQIEKLTKSLRRRRQLRQMKGSRRGYSADIEEETKVDLEEDGDEYYGSSHNTTSANDNRAPYSFYSNIKPKRCSGRKDVRQLPKPSSTMMHPDIDQIDLSLVALLSSKELDAQFHHNNGCSATSRKSFTSSSSSSEMDSNSSGNDDTIATGRGEKKLPSAARPFAVVDYGSVELNMEGSLLDSIYNIESSSSRRSNDVMIGGRFFSAVDNNNHDANSFSIQQQDNNNTRQVGMDRDFSVSSRRTPEVASVIASLKSTASTTKRERATRGSWLDNSDHPTRSYKKKQKMTTIQSQSVTMKSLGEVPTFDMTNSTTLEAAISFSPYARVLFCAQTPYTVVHTNAAYTTLVQQGHAKQCVVGEAFGSIEEQKAGASLEDYISRIVANHVGAFYHHEDSTLRNFNRPGLVHIFPVLSNDETCSQFIRSYQSNCMQRQQMDNPEVGGSMDTTAVGKEGPKMTSCNQYVSHYLLQIEPWSAQLP